MTLTGSSPPAAPADSRRNADVAYLRALRRSGRLGDYCADLLTARSHPSLRAMTGAEFWPWARSRLADYRRKHQ